MSQFSSDAHTVQALPTTEIRTDEKRLLLREVALEAPTLPDDLFAERVTARNASMAERLAAWADETRSKAEALLDQLREQPDEKTVSVRMATRLRRLARDWRVFETFRQLHEAHRCPGALFQLYTKTDIVTLCDPQADSSPAGYGECQRRVLAKRGISHRHTWAEARQLVAEIGLLDDGKTAGKADDEAVAASGEPKIVASQHAGDGVVSPEHAVVLIAPPARTEPEPKNAAEVSTCDLPRVHLDAVWTLLPGFTKAKLETVVTRFGIGLWAQFGDRFYASMRKAEMLDHTRRVVRHHACLDAAQRLTEPQVEALYEWMRDHLSRDAAQSGRRQLDDDLRIAARLFGDLQAGASLSASGSGLSPEAWNRYRDAEVRRIAAFCYHRFYEDRCARKLGQ